MADVRAESFSPPGNHPAVGCPGASTWPPARVGPFTVVREIGRGGMGCVLEARQEGPLERRVAVKLILSGIDSAQVIRRFDSERRALAIMSHPNIAQVFDAGATPDGSPWFAMELVDGPKITDYCDAHCLGLRERLELMIQIAAGVHHAHQKGVIHRDLKPANILVATVDGLPVPKIIDFGVAKAVHEPPADDDGRTRVGQWVGTPAFMSPEQMADSAGVDTRSDVYALGVLLSALLTGRPPFDPPAAGTVEQERWRQRLLSEDPPLPSFRLDRLGPDAADVARCRSSTPRALLRALRGDLDWVTMKALARDPAQRYQSVADLAADLRRHLDHQPVSAGPPGLGYRLGRFVRRHAIASVAAAAVLLTLLGGLAGTTAGMLRARTAESAARQEAETSRRVTDLLASLFTVSDPSEARGRDVTARSVLDRGAQEVESQLKGEPAVRARLEEALSRAYQGLGMYQEAIRHLRGAIAGRRAVYGEGDRVAASLVPDVAWLQRQTGDLEGAVATMKEAMANLAEHFPEDRELRGGALFISGILERDQGRFDSARASLEEALTLREAVYGPDDTRVAWTFYQLGWCHYLAGNLDEALVCDRRALDLMGRLTGANSPATAECRNDYASVLMAAGKLAEARKLLEMNIRIQEKVLGPDHPELAHSLNNLGVVLWRTGDYEGAGACFQRTLALRRRALGPDHPMVANALMNVALYDTTTGRWEEAVQAYQRALAIDETALGKEHFQVAAVLVQLATAELESGRREDAARCVDRAEAIIHKREDAVPGSVFYDLACYWAAVGDRARALENVRLCVKHGYGSLGAAEGLELLHGDPEFEALRRSSAPGSGSDG